MCVLFMDTDRGPLSLLQFSVQNTRNPRDATGNGKLHEFRSTSKDWKKKRVGKY